MSEEQRRPDDDDVSEIRNFFVGKTIFLTGATGSLGKLLVEKLLRTCGGLERIYVLLREKRGKGPHERLRELYDAPAFEPLKQQQPDFADKISVCLGDCQLPNLGLSQDEVDKLKDQVDCVVHCAATVRFDADLRSATYINVRAVRDLLTIAKGMKRLKSFIHVSTAFAHCPRKDIDEVLYEPTFTGQKLIKLVEALGDDLLDRVTPRIINEWPNTYAFTKAVAEEVCATEGKGLPLSIFRPAIVIGSSKEPVPGWVDNFYGPTGVLLATALGIMRTFHCDKDVVADVVPSDYVINAMLAAAWDVGRRMELEVIGGAPTVYNYVSGSQNPLTWGSYMNLVVKHATKIPSPLILWHYVLFLNTSLFLNSLYAFFLHTVPAYVVDFFLRCVGKNPLLLAGYKKIDKFSTVLSYFATQEWNFRNANVQDLWRRLGPSDRELFGFDVGGLNWDEYFRTYVVGCRIYLLKDPLDTVPEGKRKLLLLTVAHYTLLCTLAFLVYVSMKCLLELVLMKLNDE